jgi:cell wall-associated NlpC family hydrolase
MTGGDVIISARRYIGVPCIHQGRSLKTGVDCVGLVVCVAHDLGIPFHEPRDGYAYGQMIQSHRKGSLMLQYLNHQCVAVSPPLLGDIMVFWRNPIVRSPQHLGFRTESGIIHADTSVRSVIEQSFDSLKERFICSFRFPGVS